MLGTQKTMTAPQSPAFDPRDVEESNATGYPEPFWAANRNRYNRHLGNHAGLQNYGVVMTRIGPGGQSSHRHAHSRQDEFVYVLEGEVTLENQRRRANTLVGNVSRLSGRYWRRPSLRQPFLGGHRAIGRR
jgi:uncharacterized cupin superfamily protein